MSINEIIPHFQQELKIFLESCVDQNANTSQPLDNIHNVGIKPRKGTKVASTYSQINLFPRWWPSNLPTNTILERVTIYFSLTSSPRTKFIWLVSFFKYFLCFLALQELPPTIGLEGEALDFGFLGGETKRYSKKEEEEKLEGTPLINSRSKDMPMKPPSSL